MQDVTPQDTVTLWLRLIAVVTVLAGCILTTQALIGTMAVASTRSNMARLPGGMRISTSLGGAQAWMIVAKLAIVAWGLALFKLAAPLARMITDRGPAPGAAARREPLLGDDDAS